MSKGPGGRDKHWWPFYIVGLDDLCKEMGGTTRELQYEVAQRGLQKSRDSIIYEDEEIEADRNNNLLSLILVFDFCF